MKGILQGTIVSYSMCNQDYSMINSSILLKTIFLVHRMWA